MRNEVHYNIYDEDVNEGGIFRVLQQRDGVMGNVTSNDWSSSRQRMDFIAGGSLLQGEKSLKLIGEFESAVSAIWFITNYIKFCAKTWLLQCAIFFERLFPIFCFYLQED